MISDRMIQLIGERPVGLQEEVGAVLTGTGEDCREGGREMDAMSQSAIKAWVLLHTSRCV